jgi:hypothetical protein
MRATLHLVSAEDSLRLRPLVQPVLDGELVRHREYAPALAGVDLDEVTTFARPLLDERPRTGPAAQPARGPPRYHVSTGPLPFTSTTPRASQRYSSRTSSQVARVIWIRPGEPWDSMRLAMLTASPQRS